MARRERLVALRVRAMTAEAVMVVATTEVMELMATVRLSTVLLLRSNSTVGVHRRRRRHPRLRHQRDTRSLPSTTITLF